MLTRLRRHCLQRAVATLMVVAMLSVAGVAHACKTVQMLSLAGVVAVVQDEGHAQAQDGTHRAMSRQPADLLRHGGACHLLATVALPVGAHEDDPVVLSMPWPASLATGFHSCRWPPPKHRPRA